MWNIWACLCTISTAVSTEQEDKPEILFDKSAYKVKFENVNIWIRNKNAKKHAGKFGIGNLDSTKACSASFNDAPSRVEVRCRLKLFEWRLSHENLQLQNRVYSCRVELGTGCICQKSATVQENTAPCLLWGIHRIVSQGITHIRENRNAYGILVGTPGRRRLLGTHRHSLEHINWISYK